MNDADSTTEDGMQPPPYFDAVFSRLQEGDPTTTVAFGRHMHWGFWDDPATADGTPENYAQAAERLSHLICEHAGIRDGTAVLDVGCGFGGTIASINERYSNLELVGVNIDPRQLERAAEIVRPQNGNTIRFEEGDACNLPLKDRSFDIVLAVECIFHFPDRRAFFSEVKRVLRQEGVMSISDFIPEERIVPYLKASFDNPLERNSTKRTYGHLDFNYTMEGYRDLAESTEMKLSNEFDMTANTIPTYAFLRANAEAWDDDELRKDFENATSLMESASKKKFIRYKILTFQKQ